MARFTDEEKLAELRRERALRQRVYEERIAKGKMTVNDARYYMALIEEMIEDYQRMAGVGEQERLL